MSKYGVFSGPYFVHFSLSVGCIGFRNLNIRLVGLKYKVGKRIQKECVFGSNIKKLVKNQSKSEYFQIMYVLFYLLQIFYYFFVFYFLYFGVMFKSNQLEFYINSYLCYEMITSQNVSFEARIKIFFYFVEKLCSILKIFKFLYF